ncbi:MAG: hypothetical protein ACI9HK_001313 [Pirellulaceae bacterium]|jgi:hypothetical protein
MNLKQLVLMACVLSLLVSTSKSDPPVAGQGDTTAKQASDAGRQRRREFSTLVAHWANYADPEYLPFLDAAEPDVAQIGFYGAHFWSLADTPHGQGYPAHFPHVGLQQNRVWFADLNRQIHQREIRVVGHMNVKFLVGDPDSPKTDKQPGGPRGFFKFYADLWDPKTLGPKPTKNALDLLEKDIDGNPRTNNNYSIGGMKEYWGCLNNPHWRAVLKAWTKHGIDQGCDGFVANYFYRHNCLCSHCQSAFKDHLRQRYSPDKLQQTFAIADIETHQFQEIVGWHKPEESTPLRREMLQFSQVANKQAFDEVFVKYGRSIKPDLIVAQWNHLGNFNQISGDERCLLPKEMWGRDENYLWYSTGGSANFTDLPEGLLGEGTLQARYIRGMFGNRPYTLGKYENTRIRTAIAELIANGGAPMGFYTRFTDPAARAEIVRYYQFIKRHSELYAIHQPHHEALLLFPRKSVLAGDVRPLERFRTAGQRLLNEHVLFDVLPDDAITPEVTARYQQVVGVLEEEVLGEDSLPKLDDKRSRIQAPATVRVSLSRHPERDEFALHLVNYNRTEPAKKRSPGGGIKDEKPIAVEGVQVDLMLGDVSAPKSIEFHTPEQTEPQQLVFKVSAGRVQFTVPKFLVYALVKIR